MKILHVAGYRIFWQNIPSGPEFGSRPKKFKNHCSRVYIVSNMEEFVGNI